jgi:cytochrome c oxidase subunit 2
MNTFFKYIGATVPALIVLGVFAYFSNWIPQTRWEPPQKRQISEEMTPIELSKLGEVLVRERGCMLCHTREPGVGVKGGGRGPNLFQIAIRRREGVPGGPSNLTEYLVQALYEPGAYLVEDFSNIMPPSWAPPAKLNYEELTAVIAYLQALGGTPTVRVGQLPRPPTGTAPLTTPTPKAAGPQPQGLSSEEIAEARKLLEKYGCMACHSLADQGGQVGPALDRGEIVEDAKELRLSLEEYLRQSILQPGAYIVKGFSDVMPKDFGKKMTAEEFELLVRYLASLGGVRSQR